jgi:NarL family two-component system response regulator LiaR
MPSKLIRLLLVDDHAIVRRGVKALLAQTDDMVVIGEASDGAEAIAQASALQPDVILMDLILPDVGGIEAIRQISVRHPAIAILVLTSFASDDKVFPAIKAGALGYMLKNADLEELVTAIRQVHRGEPSLHPNIARKVLRELRQPQAERALLPEPLTARELEVLQLIAKGLSNQEIADQLVVAEPTVRTHVSRILDKLHLVNRVQATLYAMREGLTALDVDPD